MQNGWFVVLSSDPSRTNRFLGTSRHQKQCVSAVPAVTLSMGLHSFMFSCCHFHATCRMGYSSTKTAKVAETGKAAEIKWAVLGFLYCGFLFLEVTYKRGDSYLWSPSPTVLKYSGKNYVQRMLIWRFFQPVLGLGGSRWWRIRDVFSQIGCLAFNKNAMKHVNERGKDCSSVPHSCKGLRGAGDSFAQEQKVELRSWFNCFSPFPWTFVFLCLWIKLQYS